MQVVSNEGIGSHVFILLLFVDADTSPLDFKESMTDTNIDILNFLSLAHCDQSF